MAVLPPGKGSQRRPSFRGNILQDTTRGVERTRIWPEPKGSRQTKAQLDQQEWFRQVNWAFKYMAPAAQAAFTNATKDTALYPRDLLSMIASGNFVALKLEDGRIAYPMPYMQAVSESLDTISQQIGYTLVRGPQFWTATPLNAPQGVLVSRATLLAQQAVASGNILINWGAATTDEMGMWSPANPSRLTVPANIGRLEVGGSYDISGGAVSNCSIQIWKNGVNIAEQTLASGYTAQRMNIFTGPIDVAPGDYFQLGYTIATPASKTLFTSRTSLWAKFG